MPKDQGIGARSRRREDVCFLTGTGQYADDINRPGQTYACFLRSTVAHCRINGIDTAAARAAPGVVGVFTAADLESAGGVPCGWQVTGRDGAPMKEHKHPILAEGKINHVGDPVACVIAETLNQARDAAELIELDIEELPAVVDMQAAISGAPAIHDEAPDNICFDWRFIGDNKAAVDAAIADAPHVTTLELVNRRLAANAIEPRAGDLPGFRVDHSWDPPCPHNPPGVMGGGEAGANGSPPAVVNAVVDALGDLGVTHIDMPVSPGRAWAAIQAATN